MFSNSLEKVPDNAKQFPVVTPLAHYLEKDFPVSVIYEYEKDRLQLPFCGIIHQMGIKDMKADESEGRFSVFFYSRTFRVLFAYFSHTFRILIDTLANHLQDEEKDPESPQVEQQTSTSSGNDDEEEGEESTSIPITRSHKQKKVVKEEMLTMPARKEKALSIPKRKPGLMTVF
jgi:hypothetical protein